MGALVGPNRASKPIHLRAIRRWPGQDEMMNVLVVVEDVEGPNGVTKSLEPGDGADAEKNASAGGEVRPTGSVRPRLVCNGRRCLWLADDGRRGDAKETLRHME